MRKRSRATPCLSIRTPSASDGQTHISDSQCLFRAATVRERCVSPLYPSAGGTDGATTCDVPLLCQQCSGSTGAFRATNFSPRDPVPFPSRDRKGAESSSPLQGLRATKAEAQGRAFSAASPCSAVSPLAGGFSRSASQPLPYGRGSVRSLRHYASSVGCISMHLPMPFTRT